MKSPVIKALHRYRWTQNERQSRRCVLEGSEGIADDRNVTLSDLCSSIDTDRHQGNLSSAIRLFVLDYYRNHAVPTREAPVSRDLIGMRAATSVLRAE